MGDRIKDILERVPYSLFVGLYVVYTLYGYYSFNNDPASPLLTKQAEIQQVQAENQKLRDKIKLAQEFLRSLEAKKQRLRELTLRLEQMKATLSEDLDVGEFMKVAVTEARKVGLTVLRLRPDAATPKEQYFEQKFQMSFRGVFVQLLVFLDRMSKVQKIVRVDNFEVKPTGNQGAKYVTLEGNIELKVYKYMASKADELARSRAATSSAAGGTAPPGATPGAAQPGGGR